MKKICLIAFLILFSTIVLGDSIDYSKDYIFQTDDFILRLSIGSTYDGDVLILEFIPRKSFDFVPFLSSFTDNFGKEAPLVIEDRYYGYLSSNSITVYSVEIKDTGYKKNFTAIPITHLTVKPGTLSSLIKFIKFDPNIIQRKLKIAYVVDKEIKYFETTINLATK